MAAALDADLAERLAKVSFPTLGHFLEEGFADHGIRALIPGKLVGRAVTLRLIGADALAVNDALALLQPGDVLVIDMGGDHAHAPVGAVTACAAKCAGAKAVIVDGVVTDILELRDTDLPIFARGTSVLTTKRRGLKESAINVDVVCGGVAVRPGDLVLADDNGVLFTTIAKVAPIIDRAIQSDLAEPATLARLRSGEKVGQVLG